MTDCQHLRSEVKDSRPAKIYGVKTVRRRRLCFDCKMRFNTFELSADQIYQKKFINLEDRVIEQIRITCREVIKNCIRDELRSGI